MFLHFQMQFSPKTISKYTDVFIFVSIYWIHLSFGKDPIFWITNMVLVFYIIPIMTTVIYYLTNITDTYIMFLLLFIFHTDTNTGFWHQYTGSYQVLVDN